VSQFILEYQSDIKAWLQRISHVIRKMKAAKDEHFYQAERQASETPSSVIVGKYPSVTVFATLLGLEYQAPQFFRMVKVGERTYGTVNKLTGTRTPTKC
jgi:hypothetical protein